MVTYLYCVLIATGGEPPRVNGVGGKPVRALTVDDDTGIEAWVATLEEGDFRLSGRELSTQALVHNDIVSTALASGRTLLPARFGAHFSDDVNCVAILSRRAAQLRDALRRLAGTVEMSVLVIPSRASQAESGAIPERAEPAAGRRYLEVVRERARQMEAAGAKMNSVVGELHKAVYGLTLAASASHRSTGIVSIAHLLRREDLTRYREAIAALGTFSDVRIIVSGPRAPYNFVGANMLTTGHDSSSPDVSA